VNLGIEWKPGKQTKTDASLCSQFMLGLIIDSCDANNPNNVMNWKGGGSVTVDLMTFHIDPVATRQPAQVTRRELLVDIRRPLL
jgi:Alpha-galactosyl-binding fungal lectin